MSYGLGRVQSFDYRDLRFAIRKEVEVMPNIRYKYYNPSGIWLDQGNTSSCVGHGWAHFIEDGPIMYKTPGAIVDPFYVYNEARKVDEWEGEDYDGTSVRAGAKVLQKLGYIGAYNWAFDLDTLIKTVLTKSPVVVGTYWYNDMFWPGNDGIVKVGGRVDGGHCYMINGIHLDKALFRFKNSWGREWGERGHGWISFEDMERLIHEAGEICLPTETKKL